MSRWNNWTERHDSKLKLLPWVLAPFILLALWIGDGFLPADSDSPSAQARERAERATADSLALVADYQANTAQIKAEIAELIDGAFYRKAESTIQRYAVASAGDLDSMLTRLRNADTRPKTNAHSLPSRGTIDQWLIGWSTAQAASMRETCDLELGCDPSQYLPQARPATTFGWSGASSVKAAPNWAQGPRATVVANRRSVLMYFKEGVVVGVYLFTSDGGRRNLCRNEACRTP